MWGGGGGTTTQEEGQVKFYSYKRGSEKVLAMLKGVQLTWELEVLAIYTNGRAEKKLQPFKRGRGHKTFYAVLSGGRKKFQTCNFPIRSPTSPPLRN